MGAGVKTNLCELELCNIMSREEKQYSYSRSFNLTVVTYTRHNVLYVCTKCVQQQLCEAKSFLNRVGTFVSRKARNHCHRTPASASLGHTGEKRFRCVTFRSPLETQHKTMHYYELVSMPVIK